MKEFYCKVSSTWSGGKVRAEAFTHRHLGKDRKEELSQLDYIRAHEKKCRSVHPQCRKTMGHLGSLFHFRENSRKNHMSSLSEKE